MLVPLLLSSGYIRALIRNGLAIIYNRTQIYIFKKDIRNLELNDFKGIDVIIHLANIANDPAVELNPTLSWEVNVLCSQQICDFAARQDIQHLIYASSGSVYGLGRA